MNNYPYVLYRFKRQVKDVEDNNIAGGVDEIISVKVVANSGIDNSDKLLSNVEKLENSIKSKFASIADSTKSFSLAINKVQQALGKVGIAQKSSLNSINSGKAAVDKLKKAIEEMDKAQTDSIKTRMKDHSESIGGAKRAVDALRKEAEEYAQFDSSIRKAIAARRKDIRLRDKALKEYLYSEGVPKKQASEMVKWASKEADVFLENRRKQGLPVTNRDIDDRVIGGVESRLVDYKREKELGKYSNLDKLGRKYADKQKELLNKIRKDHNNTYSNINKDMKRHHNTMVRNTKSAFNGIRNIIAGIAGVIGTVFVAGSINNLITDAYRYNAALVVLKRTLGEYQSQYVNWIEKEGRSWGLAKSDAMHFSSTFSLIVTNSARNTREAYQLTSDLIKASSTMMLATGRTQDDVLRRIRSGLLGNTEAIEDLGIFVNVSQLKATKAFKEFAKGRNWDKLDLSTKQIIVAYGILEQVDQLFGKTFKDTVDLRLVKFRASVNDVKLAFGQLALVLANIVLPSMTAFLDRVELGIQKLTTFFKVISGGVKVISGKTLGEVNDSLNENTELLGDNADAQSNFGKSVSDAAKKAQGGVASFDEVITLQKNIGTSGIGDSGFGYTTKETPQKPEVMTLGAVMDTTKWESKLRNIRERIGDIREALKPLKKAFQDVFGWVQTNILEPFADWLGQKLIPEGLDVITAALEFATPVLESFGRAFKFVWEDLGLKDIASWVGDRLIDILNLIEGALKKLTGWAEKNPPLLDLITTYITLFTLWEVIAKRIVGLLGNIINFGSKAILGKELIDVGKITGRGSDYDIEVDADGNERKVKRKRQKQPMRKRVAGFGKRLVTTPFVLGKGAIKGAAKAAPAIGTAGKGIAKAAPNALSAVTSIGSKVLKVIATIFTTLGGLVSLPVLAVAAAIAVVAVLIITNWDKIKEKALIAWEGIKEKWDEAKEWFVTLMENIETKIEEKWESIKTRICETYDGVKEKWDEAKEWFATLMENIETKIKEKWESIKTKIYEAYDGVKEKWDGAKEWFATLMENIETKIEEKWESIKTKIYGAYDRVKEKWGGAKEWFGTLFDRVKQRVTDKFNSIKTNAIEVWDNIKKAWSGAKTWFDDNITKPIKTLFGSLVGSVVTGINTIIGGLNKIQIKIPKWSPIGAGETFGFNIKKISIPKLADGGIVGSGTTFIAGEAGREVVFPLENSDFIDKFAEIIANKILNNSKQSKGNDVNINVGYLLGDNSSLRYLAELVMRALAENQRLSGDFYSGVIG